MSISPTSRLDRVIDLCRAVLDRIERGDQLSDILPQARLIADIASERKYVHWLDFEIYGLGEVPFQRTPLESLDEKEGGRIFIELHGAEDPRDATVDKLMEEWETKKDPSLPEKKMVLHFGIARLE